MITSASQKPNEDWLKIVKTGKARSKIRQSLKEDRLKQGSIGKETLDRKLRALKVNDFDISIDALVKYFGAKTALIYIMVFILTFSI